MFPFKILLHKRILGHVFCSQKFGTKLEKNPLLLLYVYKKTKIDFLHFTHLISLQTQLVDNYKSKFHFTMEKYKSMNIISYQSDLLLYRSFSVYPASG